MKEYMFYDTKSLKRILVTSMTEEEYSEIYDIEMNESYALCEFDALFEELNDCQWMEMALALVNGKLYEMTYKMRKKRKFIVRSTYTEYYETEEEAYDEDEAASKHMDRLMSPEHLDIDYEYNDRDITEVQEKEK